MDSTTPSSNTLFSSPRGQRLMFVISGAVLVIGIAVFLSVFFLRGTTAPIGLSEIGSHRATDTNPLQNGIKPPPTVPASPTALSLARRFLETAVPRKNLNSAYDIVGPWLKGGITRAQWRTGNIPVQYFPAANLKTAPLKVKMSIKNHLVLLVGLKAAPHTDIIKGFKSMGFKIGVDRIHGKWLVNYFMPAYTLPVRANPNN